MALPPRIRLAFLVQAIMLADIMQGSVPLNSDGVWPWTGLSFVPVLVRALLTNARMPLLLTPLPSGASSNRRRLLVLLERAEEACTVCSQCPELWRRTTAISR